MSGPQNGPRGIGGNRLHEWTGPLLAFAVCLFSFGILMSRLGFFQDDWHHVFFSYWQGAAGLKRFLLTDRGPFAWPVYAAFFSLLGHNPAAWHWSLMIVRFMTVLAFWAATRRIWPHSLTLSAWLALLFLVYPIFTLQPLAVAYTLHWTMYFVFMLSILSMLEALRRPRLAIWLTALALLLEITHLALIEYFSGLELARPVFVWLALTNLSGRQRLKEALEVSWPYLAVLGLYAIYRSSLAAILGFDRFQTMAVLSEFLRDPIRHLLATTQAALQDLLYITTAQWQAALDPSLIELERPSSYLILGSMLLIAALAFFTLMRFRLIHADEEQSPPPVHIALAGLLIIVLSMLPFWLTGFSIFQKNQIWSQRLALAAMPGASMLIVGIVRALVERRTSRNLVLSVLLALSVGLHAQVARSFQASWDKQKELYWQLSWRAPALEPGTIIMADQEILFYMGIYPTAFALNVLFPQVTSRPLASYWFNAGFEHVDYQAIAGGGTDRFEKYAMEFEFDAQDILAITFEPGLDQCLWVLRPGLSGARSLTEPARAWLALSDEARILADPVNAPPAMFGHEPERSWCYYFEKADLARQYGRWGEVVRLWDEAVSEGFRAPNGVELTPFIEAFAREGDWAQASVLTRQAHVLPDRPVTVLCDLWADLAETVPSSGIDQTLLTEVRDNLGCPG